MPQLNSSIIKLNMKTKILEWELVPPDLEYEKYFRFKCFQIKFQKLALEAQQRAVYNLLLTWHDAAQEGKDVARSIVETLEDIENPLDLNIRRVLEIAVRTITDRDLSYLSDSEIQEAEGVASGLYREALEDSFK